MAPFRKWSAPGIVPTNPRGQAIGAGGQRAGQGQNLVIVHAALDQIQRRHAKSQNPGGPHSRPHRFGGGDRKTQAAGKITAPVVVPVVGAGGQKLAHQIAFRAHDLDPVIAASRPVRRRAEIGDGLRDHRGGHLGRRVAVDQRFDRRRRGNLAMIAVTTGVQNLQRDAATGRAHRPVMRRWWAASAALAMTQGRSLRRPAALGAKPPVTIKPAPPAARAA